MNFRNLTEAVQNIDTFQYLDIGCMIIPNSESSCFFHTTIYVSSVDGKIIFFKHRLRVSDLFFSFTLLLNYDQRNSQEQIKFYLLKLKKFDVTAQDDWKHVTGMTVILEEISTKR